MKPKHTILLAIYLLATFPLFAQNTSNFQQPVSVNTDGTIPSASAILDVQATDKGMLVPRMTTAQRTAISSPANGLLVFDTDTGSFWFYSGSAWTNLSVPKQLADADNDTKIQVEESQNENIIRLDLAGSERLVLKKNTPNSRTQILLPQNDGNIFLGTHAGDSTNAGLQNIFIGENAGRKNTAGNGNVCLGFAAGEMGAVNFSNTFIGTEAGRNNTSGDNTFAGAFAGKNTTTGGENTFIGSFTGISNTTGNFNTFVGRQAGQFNDTGLSNTYVGHGAGSLNTSGIGNVFIGLSAGSNEMGSNLLYIENSSAAVPLVWGDFASDRVGINRVATTNTLEVGGEASKATPGEWLANSDARLKKNISPLNSQEMLQKLLALQGITYEWNDGKTGSKRPEGIQYGFTAQNIRTVFPTLVEEDKLGYLQTAYGTYDAMTVEAIRALHDEIELLKVENERLKAVETKLEKIAAALNGAGIMAEE